MKLDRVLEPEVMDTFEEATDYDDMDHSQVNRQFVDDLLAVGTIAGEVLDLGTGTARIPVELCRRNDQYRVVAVDMSIHMLELARYNIEVEGLIEQIMLDCIDAKQLPFADGRFAVVMSNSIIHHIPHPQFVLAEAIRVTAPGGLLFFRDLMRPADEATVQQLVDTYAGKENDNQRKMFDDSLRASLDLQEMRTLVERLGFAAESVRATSDRHWTWIARRNKPEDVSPPSQV